MYSDRAENDRLRAEKQLLQQENAGLRHDIERHVAIAGELATENERLRLGLKMIADMEYDRGYDADDFAAAVLSGDEPQKP